MMLAAAGIFLAARRKPSLPYDAEVVYLESTGTQWIDTGYAFQDNFSYEIDFKGIALSSSLFGGRHPSVRTAVIYHFKDELWPNPRTALPIAGLNGPTTPFLLSDLSTGRHQIKMAAASNKGSVWVDGVVVFNATSFSGTYISGITQVLFGDNFGGGDVRELTASKVYSLKMWQGNTLVRDFIPVRFTNEQNQSEGAMYDRANPTVGMDPDGSPRTDGLYRNRGTGAFTWAEKSA